MEFGVLGPLAVWEEGREIRLGAAKQRAVLAVLLLRANEPVSKEGLIDVLWGERPPATAVKAAQLYVSQLRKALGAGVIETRQTGYVLELEPDALDARRFERLLERGRTLLADEAAEQAAGVLREALGMWRGPALADFQYEAFARDEIARLEELRLVALGLRLEADLECGRGAEVVPELEALVRDHPLRERLHELLILALYRTGRQADALAAYHEARTTLVEELGLDPGQSLRELEKAILRHDPSLDLKSVAGPRARVTLSQWRGLQRPAKDLLERDGAIATLAEAREASALGNGRVVSVTGEPGIGKTSIVTSFVEGLEPGSRVLFGRCDDLSIPRPLGPIRDLVGVLSAPLEDALASNAAPHEIHTLLIAELERAPQPTVLVLEDVHWADEATLDLITVIGRRIGTLPALVVLTYRTGEVAQGHPLRTALGAIRADDSAFLELAPLSASAVATLAGEDAEEVYAVTGGNPFYVTELLGARPSTELPSTVANAVLGRASRLLDDAWRLLQLVSVVPSRVATSVLGEAMPGWPEAAEEPERRRLLEVDPWFVRFRHELAREAICASIPNATRRRLHGEILAALLDLGADPSDIVHQAEGAGDETVLAEYTLIAARRATALESTREAYSHYRRALDFVDRLAPSEQAALLEETASAAYAAGQAEDALAMIERAISAFRELGDHDAVGRCLRLGSRFHWVTGDVPEARRSAIEAVATLEPLGESAELARAYSAFAQLSILAQEPEQALRWGNQALQLATSLGDQATRAHALVNIGTAKSYFQPGDDATLLEGHAVADGAKDRHEATRALYNLGYSNMSWVNAEPSRRYLEQALAYAREHEVHAFISSITVALAWLRLRAGAWEHAECVTQEEIQNDFSVSDLLARTVLAELAVRRGDPDGAEQLNDLAARADRNGEPQRITPVVELMIEWALMTGAPMPHERIVQLDEDLRRRGAHTGVNGVRLAAWAAVGGIEIGVDASASRLFSAMQRRDWRTAANAFGEAGWTYDRALMLSLLDDPESMREAREIAGALGAAPLMKVVERMRKPVILPDASRN